MTFSNWIRGKKIDQRDIGQTNADSTKQSSSTEKDAELVRMLEKMISEGGDNSLNLGKIDEFLLIHQRHVRMVEEMGITLNPGLCQALKHADPGVRIKSIWALQVLGSRISLPEETVLAIAKLISDNDPGVRLQAMGSFGDLASRSNLAVTIPQIVAALKSPDAKIRKRAAEILAKLGEKSANVLDPLYPLLHDQDVDVAEAAKSAILKLGGKIETPASGSSQEIVQLVGLTTSSNRDIVKKAWENLEKLEDRESAIAPLMKTFQNRVGKSPDNNLPKFLGKLGTDACRDPLIEILKYARWSSDAWEQEYLAGSTCVALLNLKGGLSALRPVMPAEDLQYVIRRGLMSADERERLAITAMLTIDERKTTIADLISLFRSAPDKDESAWKVSGTLGSLGIDAVEPLLEVLRSVTPSLIQPNGSVKEGDKGKDGAPAAALVRIPGGLEKVRAVCHAEEYERILVRAHEYGDSGNLALNKALGELATPKAIGRLVFVLWQDHWKAETLNSAREALVNAGKKAHEQLLKTLEMRFPANREGQTNIRREILAILSESGDELCIPTIQEMLTSDPVVAVEARAALEAIGKRGGVSGSSEIKVPSSLPLKKIAKTGDPYIDDCFKIEFEEMYDDRDWFKIPEAKAIPDAANAGLNSEALHLSEELCSKYPDYYFSYYWGAVLYRKQKRYDDARNTLLEGLKFARSKQTICTALGDLEWERKNLPEAVKWWIKSVAVQVGSQYVTDYVAFLHLSYVAEALGIRVACSELRSWVDRIRSGQIRLNAEATNEFILATSRQETPAMRLAIELLEKHYLSKQEE